MFNGIITKILTQKEDDWGRYRIENSEAKSILAVGIIPNPSVGMYVSVEGSEVVNEYGRQFKISSVLDAEADRYAGIRCFLSDGYVHGIKAKRAENIIKQFGDDTIDVLMSDDAKIKLSLVKGIPKNSIEGIIESAHENKKYLPIILFLRGSGTKKQVESIYEAYGDKAVKILKKNPYRLITDIDGFGFAKTDALAISAGIKKDSDYRILAGIKYLLETAASRDGDCYLMKDDMRDDLAELLVKMPSFSEKIISEKIAENAAKDWINNKESFIRTYNPCTETIEAIGETVETRNIIRQKYPDIIKLGINEEILVEDHGCIYTKKMYEKEQEVASILVEMCNEEPVRRIKEEHIQAAIKQTEERKGEELKKEGIDGGFKATDEQIEAVRIGLGSRVAILSGGPGRGKTAIAEIIAKAFLAAGSSDKSNIVMLAPTGRAAQRITESTGYEAMTAHRAIFKAKFNPDEEPEDKLVICDETSMVDISLMDAILKYARKSNIIFVGDVNQIASVGPGKVLKDMIDSGVIPAKLLVEGHRNSGTIAKNSELINGGLSHDRYMYDEHFIYTPCNKDNILNTIIVDYINKCRQYGIKNVMLCTAMRERGPVSVKALNENLQRILTNGRKEARFGSRLFRIGDRVMNRKNDYEQQLFTAGRKDSKLGIFNGERGTVVSILDDVENDSKKIVVYLDDDWFVQYTKDNIDNLVLAYATTIHKCQGSEADCMMMAYTFSDYLLLNRSLFYTGETRAKKEFRFYGEEQFKYGRWLSAFDVAANKVNDKKRNTMLAERLISENKKIKEKDMDEAV